METTRQIAKTTKVNRILDFNSGILKQFLKVLMMFSIMSSKSDSEIYFFASTTLAILDFKAITSHLPPLASILSLAEELNACA